MSATSSEDPAPNDLYGILGVEKTATPSEIKKAYFKVLCGMVTGEVD